MADDEITVHGIITGETDMAWWFQWEHREHPLDTVSLPKSLVVVQHEYCNDKVRLPRWLAIKKNLVTPTLSPGATPAPLTTP